MCVCDEVDPHLASAATLPHANPDFWWMHTLERLYTTDPEAAHEWSHSMRKAWAGPAHSLFPLAKHMCHPVSNKTIAVLLATPVFKLSNHHHLAIKCAQVVKQLRRQVLHGEDLVVRRDTTLFAWITSGRALQTLLAAGQAPLVRAAIRTTASTPDGLHWSRR